MTGLSAPVRVQSTVLGSMCSGTLGLCMSICVPSRGRAGRGSPWLGSTVARNSSLCQSANLFRARVWDLSTLLLCSCRRDSLSRTDICCYSVVWHSTNRAGFGQSLGLCLRHGRAPAMMTKQTCPRCWLVCAVQIDSATMICCAQQLSAHCLKSKMQLLSVRM